MKELAAAGQASGTWQVSVNSAALDLRLQLSEAATLSLQAGQEILEVYQSDFAVELKDDSSPLTLADRRSHEVISKGLNKTGLPVLSEEGRAIPYEERKNWEYFWLVDPLDGTKEFVKRNGEFTVNIALIYKSRPVLGVIYVPVTDVLYFAAEGVGAYKVGKTREACEYYVSSESLIAKAEKLPLSHQHKRPYTVVASRSHMSKETEEYLGKLRANHGEIALLSGGSSLKFCLLAEGLADEYPRFGPTMEWDTAAGQAVVEQAGGTVINEDTGKPLVYNKENLLNPWFKSRM